MFSPIHSGEKPESLNSHNTENSCTTNFVAKKKTKKKINLRRLMIKPEYISAKGMKCCC